jgi:hypothetical protein
VRWRNTLVAVLILVALIVFYYLYETRGGEARRLEAQRAGRALGLEDAAAIAVLEVVNEHGALRLEAAGEDGWRLTRPQEARAAEQQVLAVLGSLKRVRVLRRLRAADGAPEDSGLESPGARLTVVPADGRPARVLAVGNPTPLGVGYFARRDGEADVLVVGPGAVQALTLAADELLEPDVGPMDSDESR